MAGMTRRHLIRSATLAGVGCLFAPAIIGRAHAQTRLTVASLFGDDKPETKIWHRIRDIVEARLPGQFSFNIVGNAALGGEKEVAESVRLGAVQASLSTMSALSGWVPQVQILDLPFLFRDAGHVKTVVAGATGENLRQKLASENFIVADFINYGARHLLTKEPVTRPEQLEGKRIRVIQSPLHTRLWSAFGATPIGIPIPETYNALQTGVADAMDLTKSAYAGFKLYEVVPYLTQTAHIWASGVVYFSASFWAGLDDGQKLVFNEAARDGATIFNDLIVADEKLSIAQALAHGGKVLQPETYDEWQKGAQNVWQEFADIVGGFEAIEQIRQAV